MNTDSSLLAQAREWQVLLHSGRATAADHLAAKAWRERSPAHEQAAREVDRLWALLGQVQPPATVQPVAAQAPQPPRRRRALRWSVPLRERRTVAAGPVAAPGRLAGLVRRRGDGAG
ncbi:FecR/PupR family sigma factor regulator [Pseudomonas argentinensis]|uniref:FecR/PupR family sigma factor regulator n=1 Tax=Phytopseudomonas argentinensis TaxID=289370 RepID=UPI001F230263|nr:DUF4880 domain-containing protein [Pseudomonas argentinensis]